MRKPVYGMASHLPKSTVGAILLRWENLPRRKTAHNMKWFVVQALVLSLIVTTLCAAAIGVGRLDHTPSPLQAVGLGICGGEPCFRGIKPGMGWSVVQKQFPTLAGGID